MENNPLPVDPHEHDTLANLARAEGVRRKREKAGKLSALVITILVHAVAILILTLIVLPGLVVDVPQIQAKTLTGQETLLRQETPKESVRPKPASASSSARLLTTNSASAPVFLPSSNTDSELPMIGTGASLGLGFGDSGQGAGGGGSLFGSAGKATGFIGTFYDFKKDASGKPTGLERGNRSAYTEILRGFARGSSGWRPPARYDYFTSPTKLSAKAFFFPAIADNEAGKAFQAPGTGPGLWVAHYSGNVTPSESGEFRFVGWGDNVLIVGINGKIVLDACDLPYMRGNRGKSVGGVDFPGKGGTPLFEGEWFRTLKGMSFRMDVLLGDEGGIYCAGLHLQRRDQKYGKGKGGIPGLPLVMLEPLTAKDKDLYKAYLPDSAFNGPIFEAK